MNTPSLPSYADTLTFYNPYGDDAARSREHWLNYLNNGSLAKYTADSVGCFLEHTNLQQLHALNNATLCINGTLANGFARVQGGLLAVASEVRGLAVEQAQGNRLLAGINVRLALQIEEQRLSNELQENIAELLRIPDSEKKRHANIEWGLKFFKDASRDADLYHDALKYLLQAEAAMPEDYYVLRQIGFLHLYAPPLVDFEKAADYLIRAGKYASVDSHPDAVRLGHVLAKSVRRRFSDQTEASADDVARLAAETYQHAAAAEYALGKFPSAVKLIEKGVGLDPKSDILRFFQAKYLAADGKSDLALAALNTLTLSQEFITAVANDLDLARTVASLWLPDARRMLDKNLLLAAQLLAQKRLELSGPAMKRAGFAEAQITKLLTDGGTVVAWGSNEEGQLNVPEGLSGVVAIATGRGHSLALKSDGTVVAWGSNTVLVRRTESEAKGKLGDPSLRITTTYADGSLTYHKYVGQGTVPAGLTEVTAIAAGDSHSVALKSDGTVVAWGDNSLLGLADEVAGVEEFVGQIGVPARLRGVVSIAAGEAHSVALKSNGTVVAWGDDEYGQCAVPEGLTDVISIAAGGSDTVALKRDGTVVAWGLGGSNSAGMTGVIAVAQGDSYIVALKPDGTVVAWDQCTSHSQDTSPAALSQVVAVAAGDEHSVALKSNGTVVAWGDNDLGQCTVPAGLNGVVAIAACRSHTVALAIQPYSHVLGRFVSEEEAAVAQQQAEAEAAAAEKAAAEQKQRDEMKLTLSQAREAIAAENHKWFWQKKIS